MKVIAFTGMPASGKSEAVQLAKEKGIPVVRMGDLVWEETKRQARPLDDHNVGNVAHTMRKTYGMDVWAKRTVEKIHSFNNPPITISKRHSGWILLQLRLLRSCDANEQSLDGGATIAKTSKIFRSGTNGRFPGVCKASSQKQISPSPTTEASISLKNRCKVC